MRFVSAELPRTLFLLLCPLLACSASPNALHGWFLLILVSVETFPPQRSLCCLWGSSASHSLLLLFLFSVNCLHSPYHDLKFLFVYFTPLLSSLQPPLKTGTGSVLFTVISLALRAMPSSWCRPLITNIYWMNKWMKLKRMEINYPWLTWPYLSALLNP